MEMPVKTFHTEMKEKVEKKKRTILKATEQFLQSVSFVKLSSSA